MIKINKEDLYKYYFLAFLGFFFFLSSFWFRFIRDRLPREIPFELNEWNFLVLLCIILGYSFSIYRIFFPPKTNIFISVFSLQISKILNLLYLPSASLHFFVTRKILNTDRHGKLISKSLDFFSPYKQLFIKTSKKWYNFFIYFPRFVFILAFSLDVFYYKTLFLSYNFMPIFLLTIIYKYIIYNIKEYYDSLIQVIDEVCLVELTSKIDDPEIRWYIKSKECEESKEWIYCKPLPSDFNIKDPKIFPFDYYIIEEYGIGIPYSFERIVDVKTFIELQASDLTMQIYVPEEPLFTYKIRARYSFFLASLEEEERKALEEEERKALEKEEGGLFFPEIYEKRKKSLDEFSAGLPEAIKEDENSSFLPGVSDFDLSIERLLCCQIILEEDKNNSEPIIYDDENWVRSYKLYVLRLKIYLNLSALIIWTYIFFISFKKEVLISLLKNIFYYIIKIKDIYEPFSGLFF